MTCPVCNSKNTSFIFEINNISPVSNFLFATKQEALEVPRKSIKLYYCNDCSFVFNGLFEYDSVDYSKNYNNAITKSLYFDNYLETLSLRLIKSYNLVSKRIIEIGCGDGAFLKLFRLNNFCVGIDPAAPSDYTNSNYSILKRYPIPSDTRDKDLLICKHTLEHIKFPLDFLDGLLRENKIESLYFEIPRLEYLIENNIVSAITYEHCSWYSQKAITHLFQKYGYSVLKFRKAFNNEFLGVELRKQNGNKIKTIKYEEPKSLLDFKSWFSSYKFYYKKLNERINLSAKKGKTIVLWGAAGKGVSILTNLTDPTNIAYVVDINPVKNGMFTPCSGHKIVHPDFVSSLPHPDIILITNKLYLDEIRKTAKKVFLKKIEFECL